MMDDQNLLCNRYEIIEIIEEGGMGIVYQGRDSQTGQPVAIKQLNQNKVLTQPELIERFSREAEALRLLDHPNIVKVIETVKENGQHFIIMEYIEGGSLRDLLEREVQLSIPITLTIGLDLADALTRAHRLNIIHRDLKPANVLLTQDGMARLTDFGLAKVSDQTIDQDPGLTKIGTLMGTVAYLSPEACRCETLDERADIWSLGVVIFEMLTGRLPFANQPGSPILAILSEILTQPVPDLEGLRPDAPAQLVDLVYRMLTKERDERIPSMRLVGAELENILQGVDTKHQDALMVRNAARFATLTPSPVGVPRHNLPKQTTPFIGRQAELSNLAVLMVESNNRLITILGPGGIGKTRLALEAAKAVLEKFQSGVTFVSLASLNSIENMHLAIAEAVGFQFFEGINHWAQLLDFFSDKQALLILDNFEHLLEGAEMVNEILQAAPGVKIWVTSREKLNLQSEVLFRIDGMDLPDLDRAKTVADAIEYSAIKLFVQAARRARPDFELETKDLKHTIQICQLVNGMPLGIILAAAWVEMFSPREISAEMKRSLDFLETDIRDLPERHRSMRAVFDSTWRLMSAVEQDVLMRLAVFRNGFQREAAHTVAGANLRQLIMLVNKSLLHRDPGTGRYEIHALLRQYTEDHLEKDGKAALAKKAHCSYYAAFLAERRDRMLGPMQTKALNQIEVEFENIRWAWLWAVEQRDYDAIDQASESLFIFSDMRSREHEGVALFGIAREQLVPVEGSDPHPAWGRLLLPWYDLLIQSEGRPKDSREIEEQAEQHLVLAKKRGDRLGISHAYILLGHFVEPLAAIKMYQQALALTPRLDDSFWVRIRIGFCYRIMGEFDKALGAFRQSYDRGVEIGEEEKRGWSLYNMAETEMNLGDTQNALIHMQEAYRHFSQVGTIWGCIWANIHLSMLMFFKGDFSKAKSLAQEAETIARDTNRISTVKKETQILVGYLSLVDGNFMEARNLFEGVLSAHPTTAESTLGLVFALCGLNEYTAANQALLDSLRKEISFRYQLMEFLCIPVAALILRHQNQPESALELMSLAFKHPKSPKDLLCHWPMILQMLDELRESFSTDVFGAAWERGQALDLTETLANLGSRFQIKEGYNQGKRMPILASVDYPLVEALSERETEVLQLLKTDLSGPEIAQTLMVSLNTVRFHTKNIYAKLQVNNRRSAVNQANRLGL